MVDLEDNTIDELIDNEDIEGLRYMLRYRNFAPYNADRWGVSFLFPAVRKARNSEVIRFLVEEAGLDPNIRDESGVSAASRALHQNQHNAGVTVFRELRRQGYDLHRDVATRPKHSPANKAAQDGDPEKIREAVPYDEVRTHIEHGDRNWHRALCNAVKMAAPFRHRDAIRHIAGTGIIDYFHTRTDYQATRSFAEACERIIGDGFVKDALDASPGTPETMKGNEGWSRLLDQFFYVVYQKLHHNKQHHRLPEFELDFDNLLAAGVQPRSTSAMFERYIPQVRDGAPRFVKIAANRGYHPSETLEHGGAYLMWRAIRENLPDLVGTLTEMGVSPELAVPADDQGPVNSGHGRVAHYTDPTKLAADLADADMAETVARLRETHARNLEMRSTAARREAALNAGDDNSPTYGPGMF